MKLIQSDNTLHNLQVVFSQNIGPQENGPLFDFPIDIKESHPDHLSHDLAVKKSLFLDNYVESQKTFFEEPFGKEVESK